MKKEIEKVEIYSRDKGAKRWFRTGLVYKKIFGHLAIAKTEELYKFHRGRKEFMIKDYRY